MSIQQLMDLEVTSVSKTSQPLSRSATAIFVITQEDIHRSGATSIPELLRMAPGVNVARITSSQWAVTARGFNGSLANKLLVLIDGRSVYTPLYAGVYWDTEDVPLQDIDRIEVIRGPGASLWGSNAVNGVINIITKHAKETVGNMINAGGGTEDRVFGAYRAGAAADEDTYYRIYGKYFDRGASFNGNDAWHQGRTGFRVDRTVSAEDSITFKGAYYNGENDLRGTDASIRPPFTLVYLEDETVAGGHLSGNWKREQEDGRSSEIQAYYQQSHRDQRIFKESRYTFDLDLNTRFPLNDRQMLSLGAGYRYMHDDTAGDFTARFDPADKTDHLFSAFVQDEITLSPEALWLTLGSKFEHNDYSGFEVQPSARMSWQLAPEHMTWLAVSRAVRIPTRVDHDLILTGWLANGTDAVRVYGDPGKDSEALSSYEAGYRFEPSSVLSVDVAGFVNHYTNLTTLRSASSFAERTYTVYPYFIDDEMEGDTYGGEVAVQYQMTPDWKVVLAYSFLQIKLNATNDPAGVERSSEDSSPQNQVHLRNLIDLGHGVELDPTVRYVDELEAVNTDAYIELDLRLAWHPKPNIELAVTGRNLLDDHHTEIASKSSPTAPQTERSVYGEITVSF